MAKPMTTKDKIREWISDNLRYMLLIGAILLIVAAFFSSFIWYHQKTMENRAAEP